MRRKFGSWFLAGAAAIAAANACVVPEFKSDGRFDGSGGEGGDDGSNQSTDSGGSIDGSGGAHAGGSGGGGQGDGGNQGDGGGPPGDGGTQGDGGAPGGGGSGGGGGSDTGGTGGVLVGEGPSDLPAPPGRDDVPPPDGTPGEITVLDWAGFPAAVTYTFDDNDASQLDHYEELNDLGGRYTFMLITGSATVQYTDARWQTVFDDGHEIGNHTDAHACGVDSIATAQGKLQTQFGKRSTTLGAPNGSAVCNMLGPDHVFLNRHTGPNTPILPLDDTDPFFLNAYIPSTAQAASVFNGNIDTALNQHGWIIYLIHGFQPSGSAYQPLNWDSFEDAVIYARESDVWIDTLENVGAYWLGQKAFADAVTNTNGDSTTWTWELPEHFPPEKYLRVTVDGGTLTQEDEPLIWDPHGYYEIALDAGSVTLGP